MGADSNARFVRIDGQYRPLMVITEFMTEPRRAILRRLAKYTLDLLEDHDTPEEPSDDYTVIGCVINLTGPTQPDFWGDFPPDVGGLGQRHQYRVRNLATESAEKLLEDVQAGLAERSMLVWCPLMLGGDRPQFVMNWRLQLEQDHRVESRRSVAALAVMLSRLTDCMPLWSKELEGFDVLRSEILVEAEQRGELRGELRNQRQVLVRNFSRKFRSGVPSTLQTRIETESDLNLLLAWDDELFQSDTAEDFLKKIGLN